MDTQSPTATQQHHDPQPVLTPREAAALMRMSVGFLATMRLRGTGPKYIRVAAQTVRYLRSDVLAWLEERRHSATHEYDNPVRPPSPGRPRKQRAS